VSGEIIDAVNWFHHFDNYGVLADSALIRPLVPEANKARQFDCPILRTVLNVVLHPSFYPPLVFHFDCQTDSLIGI